MIVEIAVAVADRGGKRVKQGDIVAARKPLGIIGKKESANLLWFCIDTDLELSDLISFEADEDRDGKAPHSENPGEGKRRYNIPLKQIADATGIDTAKLTDERVDYQPLLGQTILLRNPQLNKRVAEEKTIIDRDRL